MEEAGRVATASGGLLRVQGLQGVRRGTLLHSNEARFLAWHATPDATLMIPLDPAHGVKQGGSVFPGRPISFSVYPEPHHMDPLGSPRGQRAQIPMLSIPWGRPAAPIVHRDPVAQQLFTGSARIDLFHPIGFGTSVGLATTNQRQNKGYLLDLIQHMTTNTSRPNTSVVLGAMGASRPSIMADAKRLPKCRIFSASKSDPLGQQLLVPFVAAATAQALCGMGSNVVLILDDMEYYANLLHMVDQESGMQDSAAKTLHDLLSASCQLSPAHGGGSLTLLGISRLDPMPFSLTNSYIDASGSTVLPLMDQRIHIDMTHSSGIPFSLGPSTSYQDKTLRSVAAMLRKEMERGKEVSDRFAIVRSILARDELDVDDLDRLRHFEALEALFDFPELLPRDNLVLSSIACYLALHRMRHDSNVHHIHLRRFVHRLFARYPHLSLPKELSSAFLVELAAKVEPLITT